MKQFTSHINYSLTKKRIKMMSVSKSIWRALPIMIVAVSISSMLTIISCQDNKYETKVYTSQELFDMLPPKTRYEPELESFGAVGLHHPLDERVGYLLNAEGELYTGERNGYNIETGLLTSKGFIENGKQIRAEYYLHDDNKNYKSKIRTEYSVDDDGGRVFKSFSDANSDSLYLSSEMVEVDSLRTYKYYYPDGKITYLFSYLIDSSNPELLKHGLISHYDENGNLTLQERYERGELIEKIK